MTLIYLTKNVNNLIIPLKISPVASFVFLRPYAYFKSPLQVILDSSGIGYKIYYVHMHIINLKNKNVKNCFAPAVYLPFRTVKINHED